MITKKNLIKTTALLLLLLCVYPNHASALTVRDLQQALDRNEQLTLIDIRNPARYATGHIPGALNIPESLIPVKQLPAFGRVVVYGGGLAQDDPQSAADDLNNKSGIQAEVLEGGYEAWWAARGQTTETPGFSPSSLNFITYQQLKEITDDVVIADLRGSPEQRRQFESETGQLLTDLSEEFPHATVVDSPFDDQGRAFDDINVAQPPIMVLIDKGDGEAQKMARTLQANRRARVVILMGGEEIIQRKGQPGLLRMGPEGGE